MEREDRVSDGKDGHRPIPSDHAPLRLDLDEAGAHVDAGWADAEARILDRPRTAKPPR